MAIRTRSLPLMVDRDAGALERKKNRDRLGKLAGMTLAVRSDVLMRIGHSLGAGTYGMVFASRRDEYEELVLPSMRETVNNRRRLGGKGSVSSNEQSPVSSDGLVASKAMATKLQRDTESGRTEMRVCERLRLSDAEHMAGVCEQLGVDEVGLVRVYDMWRTSINGYRYIGINMRLYAGSLHSMYHRLSVGDLFSVIVDLSSGLEYFHTRVLRPDGRFEFVAHRDPHPGNILLGPDLRAKLCDFGWAGRYYDPAAGDLATMPRNELCFVDRTVLNAERDGVDVRRVGQHRVLGGSRRSDMLVMIGAVLSCMPELLQGNLYATLFARTVEARAYGFVREAPGWLKQQAGDKPVHPALVVLLSRLFEEYDCVSDDIPYAWVRAEAQQAMDDEDALIGGSLFV